MDGRALALAGLAGLALLSHNTRGSAIVTGLPKSDIRLGEPFATFGEFQQLPVGAFAAYQDVREVGAPPKLYQKFEEGWRREDDPSGTDISDEMFENGIGLQRIFRVVFTRAPASRGSGIRTGLPKAKPTLIRTLSALQTLPVGARIRTDPRARGLDLRTYQRFADGWRHEERPWAAAYQDREFLKFLAADEVWLLPEETTGSGIRTGLTVASLFAGEHLGAVVPNDAAAFFALPVGARIFSTNLATGAKAQAYVKDRPLYWRNEDVSKTTLLHESMLVSFTKTKQLRFPSTKAGSPIRTGLPKAENPSSFEEVPGPVVPDMLTFLKLPLGSRVVFQKPGTKIQIFYAKDSAQEWHRYGPVPSGNGLPIVKTEEFRDFVERGEIFLVLPQGSRIQTGLPKPPRPPPLTASSLFGEMRSAIFDEPIPSGLNPAVYAKFERTVKIVVGRLRTKEKKLAFLRRLDTFVADHPAFEAHQTIAENSLTHLKRPKSDLLFKMVRDGMNGIYVGYPERNPEAIVAIQQVLGAALVDLSPADLTLVRDRFFDLVPKEGSSIQTGLPKQRLKKIVHLYELDQLPNQARIVYKETGPAYVKISGTYWTHDRSDGSRRFDANTFREAVVNGDMFLVLEGS